MREIERLRGALAHPAITHCDNCGCDWLDNGLNPVGCPYCKQSEQAIKIEALRAEPAVWVAADTLNSPHPACISSLAYMSQLDKDRGREYVPLYATPVAAQVPEGARLWLWRHHDHFLAFTHQYPCFTPGGDPMTLGPPVGYAVFRVSHDRAAAPTPQQPRKEGSKP